MSNQLTKLLLSLACALFIQFTGWTHSHPALWAPIILLLLVHVSFGKRRGWIAALLLLFLADVIMALTVDYFALRAHNLVVG
ncbi:hypothetical protein J3F84DRAFT_372245 [Trichoderma pleuroticola]